MVLSGPEHLFHLGCARKGAATRALGGPGLARLSKSPKAKAIRKAVVADQNKALIKAADTKKTKVATANKGNGTTRRQGEP